MNRHRSGRSHGGSGMAVPVLRVPDLPSRKCPRFTDEQKSWVIARLEEHPDHSNLEIGRMFFREFGRNVNDSTVRKWRSEQRVT